MTRTCRLVHITTVPQTLGFLRGQVGYMRARGFEVHAISSPGERLDAFGREEGILVHGVPISRTISPLHDLATLARLTRLLFRLRPTIISVSTPKAALLGAIAAWLVRVPVRVYLVRGSITEGATGGRRTLFRQLERLTAALCHQVICVAPSLRDFLRREGIIGFDEGLVMAKGMSNGVDGSRYDPDLPDLVEAADTVRCELNIAADCPVVGFVGRLCADKGLDDLAAAWETLRTHASAPRLLLVGEWEPEDPVLPETCTILEHDALVSFAGHVATAAPYYKLMTVFAFPTRGEGFPNAPMEASAMGLPVVATRTVGCVDAVVDGVTGTLVPPRDPEALAEAIARYLDDPALRERHGRAGRERVLRDFQPEPIWEATYQEYVRLLRERGLPVPTRNEEPA